MFRLGGIGNRFGTKSPQADTVDRTEHLVICRQWAGVELFLAAFTDTGFRRASAQEIAFR